MGKAVWCGLLRWFTCLGLVVGLAACAPLPPLQGRSVSYAYTDTSDTSLGRAVEALARNHPGESGIVPLTSGGDAFSSRILLADAAERSLDIQYYIWHNDMAGTLMFDAVRRAADRGVRVRLLLDDNNTQDLDAVLAALDTHPNIEVRLFNPFMRRDWRILDYLTDFPRLNRRMHNKSFTADNQATIVGGRNIGDEYFGAGQEFLFIDLDVLAIGPVVRDVSADFDRYWASGSSYPASRIISPVEGYELEQVAQAAERLRKEPRSKEYRDALERLPFVRDLLGGSLRFEWAKTHMVSDDPAKGLGLAEDHEMLPQKLGRILGRPQRELYMVSSYFVPTRAGVEYLTGLARQGVKITILTNSLEATDVAAVHAGYEKRRKPLLEAGIVLYETKRMASGVSFRDRGLTGSSASSLHAKTISVDGARSFVGSFNFDPRSAELNTEMGLAIDSVWMAQQLPRTIARNIRETAYRVRLNDEGDLEWVEYRDGQQIVHDSEPGVSLWRRLGVSFLSRLPIEWLL